MNRLRIIFLGLALAVSPVRAGAQLSVGLAGPVAQADLLYLAGSPREALEILQAQLEGHPDDYEALWRAARSRVILGVSAEGKESQNSWLGPAIEFAARAIAIDPHGVDALYWHGAAVGRRAMNAKPSYATTLAQQVYEDAHAILEIDPNHGGAHNLLGKLNYEVMSLSRVERMLGRLVMGTEALKDTSWEQAEEHLSRAAQEWPELILFQFDLGLLYEKRGRDELARAAFSRAVALTAVHPPDRTYQERARQLLVQLGVQQ